MSKIWLITGSARGLGRHIAEAVLASGDSIMATARDPGALSDLVARYGSRISTAALDVTREDQAHAAVRGAIETFGRIDVLVNNAGYGHIAPFEQATPKDFRDQIETNFFGVVHLTQAVLPGMREQRAGHIFNISSVGGRIGIPGLTAYNAAKWAVGGFTEALSQEAKPFGVKVISVEPGGMRTGWGEIAGSQVPELLPDYEPTVGALAAMLAAHNGQAAGDPAKVAQVILQLARHDDPPAHLLLGSDALHYFSQADEARARDAETWRAISLSTDMTAGPQSFPTLPRAGTSR